MKSKIIEFLLENANPSIVLRVKKEVLNHISNDEEMQLFEKILVDKNVKIATESQGTDGWIGEKFHGSANHFDNMEVGLRFLAEKGFPPDCSIIRNAVQALTRAKPNDPVYRMTKFLELPENDYKYTASGVYLARSSVILRAGYEEIITHHDNINLQFDIQQALKCFFNVLQTENPEAVLYRRRNKLCFVDGTLWPCIYDLRILAHSNNWRTKENYNALFNSINKLYKWPQDGEFVYTYIKGQLKGPCMAFIHKPINESLFDGSVGGMYFDRLELLARCGAVSAVDKLQKEYEMLLSLIDNNLMLNIDVKNKYAIEWSPYFGFALEEDWKSKTKKQCDILFRILLIMHHTELTKLTLNEGID